MDISFEYFNNSSLYENSIQSIDNDFFNHIQELSKKISLIDIKSNKLFFDFLNTSILFNSEQLLHEFKNQSRVIIKDFIEKNEDYYRHESFRITKIKEYYVASQMHFYFREAWFIPIKFYLTEMSEDYISLLTSEYFIEDIDYLFSKNYVYEQKILNENYVFFDSLFINHIKENLSKMNTNSFGDKLFFDSIHNSDIRISINYGN